MHNDLEEKLRRKSRRNNLIIFAVAVVCLIICIVFAIIRENTKEVVEYGSGIPFIGGYKSVTYNTTYSLLAGMSFIVSIMSFITLLLTLIFTRINTVEACGSTITLYRGVVSVVLYVDGKEASRSHYFLEATLANGATVTVSLSRNGLFAHMSFSGGHPPIEL